MRLSFESLDEILPAIRSRATNYDRTGDWPDADLKALEAVGACRWFVPATFGGEGIDPLELHLRYESIASASLATALIVSQRDSAVGLIDGSENDPLRQQILPELAKGESFSTIGIAQLTTSRQAGLRAKTSAHGFILDGKIPWSTGAAKAKTIVAGAVTEDNQQILFVLPSDLPGVSIDPPMELVALRSSWTSQVRLDAVELDRRQILRGPAAKVLGGGTKGIPLAQAFLAFGLCRGALQLMASENSDRSRSLVARFEEQLATIRTEVLEICRARRESDAIPRLRGACNDLAVRITQSAVALFKGSALRLDHPAQRLAREAMFFLVWSCTDPVIDCTVNALVDRTIG
jgi:butyryl-CoA dehydrogenase